MARITPSTSGSVADEATGGDGGGSGESPADGAESAGVAGASESADGSGEEIAGLSGEAAGSEPAGATTEGAVVTGGADTRVTAEDADARDVGVSTGGPADSERTVSTKLSDAPTVSVPSPRPAGSAEFEEVTANHVVQDALAEPSLSELRVDFGAHLEANYQRLVAQLYAITLNPDQAHSVVQDAYSRAWRNWAVIGRSADPTGWVRRVAVRTTIRSWRNVLARFGLVRAAPPVAEGLDERTTALLTALRELPPPERRSVVLFHMAGLSQGEIAAIEQVSPSTVSTRLDRARRVVMGDTGDLLTGVIELPGVTLHDDRGYVREMSMPPADPRSEGLAGHLDDRWERADTWNGGPDGSWPVSEAPPWEAPNSADPWPGAEATRSLERGSPPGDDPATTADAGAGRGNDLLHGHDGSRWAGGSSAREAALNDEFDTVAPDGTVVSTAGAGFAPEPADPADDRKRADEAGRAEGGTDAVDGTEDDGEGRR